MASETKDDSPFEEMPGIGAGPILGTVANLPPSAPRATVGRGGPPKWGSPFAADAVGGAPLIRTGPMPPTILEQLESSTTAAPIGIPGPTIGTGVGIEPLGVEKKRVAVPRGEAVVIPRPAPKPVEAIVGGGGAAPAVDLKTKIPLTGEMKALAGRFMATDHSKVQIHPRNAVTSEVDVFVPPNRRYFKEFIIQSYWRYKLKDVPLIPDPDACAKAAEASKKEQKSFAYQAFVRDYMQRPTPYRGVLVYHGLGSGKTCTSIAALEALYQEKQRPVYILTPASLQPNYRDEITKCGPYIYRIQNHWTWVSVPTMSPPTQELALLLEVVGIPRSYVAAKRGGWVPDPAKPANYDSLTGLQQKAIQDQILEIMNSRFIFINYNGVRMETVKAWACAPGGPRKFDGATIVIDEIHNLVRTVNGSDLERMYKDEPRSSPQYMPKACNVASIKYNRSYLLYRLLCDAVGAKIIGLSATPIINFPQEIGILANLLAGDSRMAEVTISVLDARKKETMTTILREHPEVDFFEIKARGDGTAASVVRLTPVSSGFRKVINPKTGEFRGFIRDVRGASSAEEIARERDLSAWFARVNAALTEKGVGITEVPKFSSFQRLPDTEKVFTETFINTDSLDVKEDSKFPLMARLSGLISYYKGGKADLMASNKEYLVEVEMSDLQLKEYTIIRKEEIDKERTAKKKKKKDPTKYDKATESVNSSFKIFSRAACNFAFPDEVERPIPSDYRDVMKMLGEKIGAAADAVAEEADRTALDPEGVLYQRLERALPLVVVEAEDGAAAAAAAEEVREVEAVAANIAVANAATAAKPATYEEAITTALRTMRARAPEFFRKGLLKNLSPKFQAILDRIELSQGPVLVYSNFKTLEGVGLFSIALEAQNGYKRLDIVNSAGEGWKLTADTLGGGAGAPRYISYTGDEDREKRNILLAIYNAKWDKVPRALGDAVKALTGVTDNKAGKICRVLMITQSGAEGLNLANVRQVHIMEPYWNYVRLDQVKGRAIRICSHMGLPPDQRHVDTYIYLSKFSKKQVEENRVDETLRNFDGAQTTDQNIWGLMNAKKKLAESVLNVMKSAAVDCELFATENGGGYGCYRIPKATMEPLFHPKLEVDLTEGAAAFRELAPRAAPRAIAGEGMAGLAGGAAAGL